jgi:hypothetical protein
VSVRIELGQATSFLRGVPAPAVNTDNRNDKYTVTGHWNHDMPSDCWDELTSIRLRLRLGIISGPLESQQIEFPD